MFFTAAISEESTRVTLRKFLRGNGIYVCNLGDCNTKRNPPIIAYSMMTTIPVPLTAEGHPLLNYMVRTADRYKNIKDLIQAIGAAKKAEKLSMIQRERLPYSIYTGPLGAGSQELRDLFNYFNQNNYRYPLAELRSHAKKSHLTDNWGWPRPYKRTIYIGINEGNTVGFTSRWNQTYSRKVNYETFLQTITDNDKNG